MAMPVSGSIGITTCPNGTCSSICAAVFAACGFHICSLSSLSTTVGKTAPHCMREFYGYTPVAAATLSVSPTTINMLNTRICTVTVTASVGNTWCATSSNSLIASVSPSSGTGSGTFGVASSKFNDGVVTICVTSAAPTKNVTVYVDVFAP